MVIKKIKANKRHIAVDNEGLILAVIVDKGNQHDSQQLTSIIEKIKKSQPFLLETILADKAYQGYDAVLINDYGIILDIKVNLKESGFQIMDARWKVGRTFAWMKGCRRVAKDYEKSKLTSQAYIMLFAFQIISKKIHTFRTKHLSG